MNAGKVFRTCLALALFVSLSAVCFAAEATPVFVSADGALTLVTGPNSQGLQVINNATGEAVAVTNQKAAGFFASISPDNLYVCYKGFKADDGALLQAPMLFSIPTGQTIQLNGFVAVAGTPAVGADGKIAYTVGNRLTVLDKGFASVGSYELDHHVNLLAISPAGNAIAYNNKDEQIVVLDLASGAKTVVTDGLKAYWGPKFSPDGSKVLASSVSGDVACAVPGAGMRLLGKGTGAAWIDADTVAFVEKVIENYQVKQCDLVVAGAGGAVKSRSQLCAGNADAAISAGAIVSAQAGALKLGNISQGKAAWKKDLAAPAGLGGEVPDAGIESVIVTGDITEITGVPYIHQCYDTLDTFSGSWACGATAALMAMQYYDILPANTYTVSYPYTHTSDYGFYISEIYTFNGHTYDIRGKDAAGQWAYGGYGYIIQNNWEDTKTHMAEYISYHGPASAVDWSPTYAKAASEVYTGCPFVLLNSLTTAGHYCTVIGYYSGQYTLVFNDPYGNKNTPGYPSYDGTRVFYDWPGYNYGNQNLNTVWCYIWCRVNPGPTPIPTETPLPTPTPAPGTDMIIDNDGGAPYYVETGTWTTSGSTGYNGGTYRYATAGGAHTATWTAPLSTTGNYNVFVFYRAGANRPTSTKYVVHAAGGDQTVYINQTINDMVWVSLGTFPFNAGDNSLTVDALGSTPAASAVIADAARFTLASSPTPTPEPTVTPTPTLTPTPTPVPIDMYVNDIAMSWGKTGTNYYGRATIWIKDVQGGDVSGATVSYQWSGSVNQTSSAVTLGDGKVTVQSPSVKNGGTFIITITNVTASGYTYNSALNVETSDSITAP